jgi:hypothetical protein
VDIFRQCKKTSRRIHSALTDEHAKKCTALMQRINVSLFGAFLFLFICANFVSFCLFNDFKTLGILLYLSFG